MRRPEAWRNEIRVCSGCKAEFRPKREWAKHCSPKCRQRVYVERKEGMAREYSGA